MPSISMAYKQSNVRAACFLLMALLFTQTYETTANPTNSCPDNGCIYPQPSAQCRTVVDTYPNGVGCEPACPRCIDDPAYDHCDIQPQSLIAGCEMVRQVVPTKNCQRVIKYNPNGSRCLPECAVCLDKVLSLPHTP